MTTLFNATLKLAEHLMVIRNSVVDSGNTTTIVDALRDEVDSAFSDGSVWLTYDAGGLKAAPEGEFSRVTAFDNATSTITHEGFTSAVGAGDRYAVSNGRYPLDVLISAINRELVKYKSLRYDSTSLDVVQAQTEYTLPAGITKSDLINVYVETIKSDDNDHQWTEVRFDVHESTIGGQHTLILESEGLGVGYDLMLEYYEWHPRLAVATDEIDEHIPTALWLDAAAANCEVARMRQYDAGSDMDMEMLKYYRAESEKAERRYPIRYKQSKGRVMESGGSPAREQGVALTTE